MTFKKPAKIGENRILRWMNSAAKRECKSERGTDQLDGARTNVDDQMMPVRQRCGLCDIAAVTAS